MMRAQSKTDRRPQGGTGDSAAHRQAVFLISNRPSGLGAAGPDRHSMSIDHPRRVGSLPLVPLRHLYPVDGNRRSRVFIIPSDPHPILVAPEAELICVFDRDRCVRDMTEGRFFGKERIIARSHTEAVFLSQINKPLDFTLREGEQLPVRDAPDEEELEVAG